MGQYYQPILITEKGTTKVFSRDVDGEYTGAKLMEHSWFDNTMVNTFCNELLNKQCRVAWVGDYADEYSRTDRKPNNINEHELAWLVKLRKRKGHGMKFRPLAVRYMLLVNHTKKEFIDLYDYEEQNTTQDHWCTHPLPLLTAVGNGFGGGDYWGENQHLIGSWALDCIELVSCDKKQSIVQQGYAEKMYVFKEN